MLKEGIWNNWSPRATCTPVGNNIVASMKCKSALSEAGEQWAWVNYLVITLLDSNEAYLLMRLQMNLIALLAAVVLVTHLTRELCRFLDLLLNMMATLRNSSCDSSLPPGSRGASSSPAPSTTSPRAPATKTPLVVITKASTTTKSRSRTGAWDEIINCPDDRCRWLRMVAVWNGKELHWRRR